ncbi:hypothetical protein [Paenibacillus koleovorans]|uniref:hypothetical protein n=1 Tax=Paenibacillus koleovorans TaxID=121608 RepID=UPI000FDA313C|nr:hypothetical protein [Paenibacillus koleovorans]
MSVPLDGEGWVQPRIVYCPLGEDNIERVPLQLPRLLALPVEAFNVEGLLMKSVPLADTGIQRQAVQPDPRPPGYHANVIGLLFGMLQGEARQRAVLFVKEHMLSCFPNCEDAPRLAHPSASHDRLITPNFEHFSLQALWREGEAEFVLEQVRRCWGWMLDQGATTLLEVFDTRWSHCHGRSATPTWLLSRLSLGLAAVPELDQPELYELAFRPAGLSSARGSIPSVIPGSQTSIRIEWEQHAGRWFTYRLHTDSPITIRLQDTGYRVTIQVQDRDESDKALFLCWEPGDEIQVTRSLSIALA